MSILKKNINSKEKTVKLKDMELIKPNGCIISKGIYEKKFPIKWLYRDESVNETDSGWRVFGASKDTNLIIVDIETIIKLLPIFKNIKDYPVGTDLELNNDAAGDYFTETKTGTRLWF